VGWQQNNRNLVEINDVNKLTTNMIDLFVRRFGCFDLVIGGSSWINLDTRHSCIGLEGEHLSLFYHYVWILDDARSAMRRIVYHCSR
jgi:hypothetical protein